MLELQGIQNVTTIFMHLVAKLYKNLRSSFKAGLGNLLPANQNYPPRPFTNCSNYMARLVVLYFMSLPSLQDLVLHTYEKPHWTINVLYVVFSTFITNSVNQELIWLKLHNLPSISNVTNSERNGIVDRKLVRPARPCRMLYSIFKMPKFSAKNFCDGLEMKSASPSAVIQQAGAPETAAKSVTPCFTFD